MERMENQQIVAPYTPVPTKWNRERICRTFYVCAAAAASFWLIALTLYTYQ